MSKNICFLISAPLTQKDYDQFGVERLTDKGFQVWFLDFSSFLKPARSSKNLIPSFKYEKITIIQKQEHLEEFFKGRTFDFFIIIDLCYHHYKISRLIMKFIHQDNITYGRLYTNSHPERKHPLRCLDTKFGTFIDQCGLFFKKNLFDFIKFPIIPDFILAGALSDRKKFPKLNKKTKIIWAHALDYDLYLDSQKDAPDDLIEHPYAVYLDEGHPIHSDDNLPKNSNNAYLNEYYMELNKTLDHLEKKLKIPIVIAEHPLAARNDNAQRFKGRKVFKNKSIDLVSQSKFVLVHDNTLLNFAVIFEKPIIFVKFENMIGTLYNKRSDYIAKQFQSISMDSAMILKGDFDNKHMIDQETYTQYRENYIKSINSPENYFWDIAADSFNILCNLQDAVNAPKPNAYDLHPPDTIYPMW